MPAPVKPAGKGLSLNGKIGPVPVKLALVAVVVLVGYLYLRHRKGSQSSSAGSSATPTPSSTLPISPGDATGGGASGGGVPIDTPAAQNTPPAPSSFPPVFNFSFSTPGPGVPESGGNVSTPSFATVSSASQPTTTYTNTGLGLGGGVDQVSGFFFSPPAPAVLSGAQAGADIGSAFAFGSGKTAAPGKSTAAQVNAGQAALNTRAKTLTKKPLY